MPVSKHRKLKPSKVASLDAARERARKVKHPLSMSAQQRDGEVKRVQQKEHKRQKTIVKRLAGFLVSLVKAKVIDPTATSWASIEKNQGVIVREIPVMPRDTEANIPRENRASDEFPPGMYAGCACCGKKAVVKGQPLPHGRLGFVIYKLGPDILPLKLQDMHVSLFLCDHCGGPGSAWFDKLIEIKSLTADYERALIGLSYFHAVPGLIDCTGCQLLRNAIGCDVLERGGEHGPEVVLRCQGCSREEEFSERFWIQYKAIVGAAFLEGLRGGRTKADLPGVLNVAAEERADELMNEHPEIWSKEDAGSPVGTGGEEVSADRGTDRGSGA